MTKLVRQELEKFDEEKARDFQHAIQVFVYSLMETQKKVCAYVQATSNLMHVRSRSLPFGRIICPRCKVCRKLPEYNFGLVF